MKKKCLEDWLTALRSQNYKACYGALHKNDGFCALGVLCDISGLAVWQKDLYSNKESYFGQVNYLPKEVREWAGLSEKEYNSMSAFVMVINDTLKPTLDEMADLLETKYKKNQKDK